MRRVQLSEGGVDVRRVEGSEYVYVIGRRSEFSVFKLCLIVEIISSYQYENKLNK